MSIPRRYFLYARRSSDENSSKQTQSLEGQLQECYKAQVAEGLKIVETFQESRTAKKPGRPLFDAMLARIQKGEADAILCYHLDRLTRNPKDSGDLRWLLQQGIIAEIRTPHQSYLPRDSVLLTGIETTMAEQFIVHHTERVERGMRQKLKAGGFPHRAPEGYLNDKAERTIVTDPVRFPLLRHAWEMLLTGAYSVPQIHARLHEEWGYRKRPRFDSKSDEIPMSAFYVLFSNPFYAGIARSWGEQCPGRWPAMVSMTEFEQAQVVLGRRSHVHVVRHTFAYTGLIRCGRCGCQITAEVSNGHTYYHCTNRKGICSYRGLRAEEVEAQLDTYIERLQVFPEFVVWADEMLAREGQQAQSQAEAILRARQEALLSVRRQQELLVTMRLKEQVEEEEYVARREVLRQEQVRLEVAQGQVEQDVARQDSAVREAVLFAATARSRFRSGTIEEKRLVARYLASAYTLKDGRLQVELNENIQPILAGRKNMETIWGALESPDFGSDKVPSSHRKAVVAVWYGILEGIRGTVRARNDRA